MSNFLQAIDSSSLSEINHASKNLFKYVRFMSKSKFDAETIRFAEGLTPEQMSQLAQLCEMFLGNSAAVPLYSEALIKSLQGSAYGFISKTSEFLKIINFTKGSSNSNILKYEIEQNSGASGLLIKESTFDVRNAITNFAYKNNSLINFSNVHADVSALFLNIIPAIEMSMCTPYVDIKIIIPDIISPTSTDAVYGINVDNIAYYPATLGGYYSGNNIKFQKPTVAMQMQTGGRAPAPVYVSGMEIFQSPQVAILSDLDKLIKEALNGNSILEPLAPPATLEKLTFNQVGQGAGSALTAVTNAELSIIIHDKSRLSDFEPLVTIDRFPSTKFRITLGWSHPNVNSFSSNDISRFLNSMKVTQDFMVSKVSLSTGSGNGINLKISLVSTGISCLKNAPLLAASGKYVPMTVVKNYISELERYLKLKSGGQIATIGGQTDSNSDESFSSADLIDYEIFTKNIKEPIKTTLGLGIDTKILSELISKQLQEAEVTQTTGTVGNEFSKIRNIQIDDTFSHANENFSNFPIIGNKHFIKSYVYQVLSGSSGANASKVMPLYAAINRFVAAPLATCVDGINEIRINFMSFNDQAGYFSGENIGLFPIVLNDLNFIVDSTKLNALNMLESIVSQPNKRDSIFLGYNKVYLETTKAFEDKDKSNAEIQKEISTSNSTGIDEQAPIIKNALYAAYGQKSTMSTAEFIPPQIRTRVEIVPAYEGALQIIDVSKADKNILQITIYDAADQGGHKDGAILTSLMSSLGNSDIFPDAQSLGKNMIDFVSFIKDSSTGMISSKILNKKKLFEYASTIYPTITVGGEGSLVLSSQFSTQTSGMMSDNLILKNLAGNKTQLSVSSVSSTIQDINILPITLSLTMMGNPLILRGQVYYVDFGTGTTLDNTYSVQSVSHSVDKGSFRTTVTMMPVFNISMKSVTRKISSLINSYSNSTTTTVPEQQVDLSAANLHNR